MRRAKFPRQEGRFPRKKPSWRTLKELGRRFVLLRSGTTVSSSRVEIPAGRYDEAGGQIAEKRGKSRGNEEEPPFEVVGAEMDGLDEIAMALADEVDFPAGQSVIEEGLWVSSLRCRQK